MAIAMTGLLLGFITDAHANVIVLNGTYYTGAASNNARELREEGLFVKGIGNAANRPENGFETTLIECHSDYLKKYYPKADYQYNADLCQITLGRDYANYGIDPVQEVKDKITVYNANRVVRGWLLKRVIDDGVSTTNWHANWLKSQNYEVETKGYGLSYKQTVVVGADDKLCNVYHKAICQIEPDMMLNHYEVYIGQDENQASEYWSK